MAEIKDTITEGHGRIGLILSPAPIALLVSLCRCFDDRPRDDFPIDRVLKMPLSRIIRIGEDTIERLEKAASLRHKEATDLAGGGHHLASIYLAGYAVEMTLAASYFSLLPYYKPKTSIVESERKRVLTAARGLSNVEDKSHPIDGLARYLVQERPTYKPPGFDLKFANALILRVDEICQYWAPRLRYRGEQATPEHSRLVLSSASWIMENCPIS